MVPEHPPHAEVAERHADGDVYEDKRSLRGWHADVARAERRTDGLYDAQVSAPLGRRCTPETGEGPDGAPNNVAA